MRKDKIELYHYSIKPSQGEESKTKYSMNGEQLQTW